jgi:O-antigen/teichoic acid export membrane protein
VINILDKKLNYLPCYRLTKIILASTGKFIGPGILLFLNQSLIAAINWIYWLIMSKVSTTSELGQATTVTNLVLLIATITQLGLEYPLLKRASTDRSQIIGTILIIELVFALVSMPIVIYAINSFFDNPPQVFGWLAIALLAAQSLNFVCRFTLLGFSNVKAVLIIDFFSTLIKFVVGYFLVLMGFGVVGILFSFLFQSLVFAGISLILARRILLGFSFGDIRYFKDIISDGVANFSSKLSRMFVVSLSVVLLASFNLSSSEIGIYYVTLMISFIVGASASSMAYMVIPASLTSKKDLSSDGMRISLSIIAPLITALVVSPKYILSLVGTEYVAGYFVLVTLSIAVLPSTIVINTISKFNNLNKSRRLLIIGSIQLFIFFLAFFYLVPVYGSVGAALATLIAFICSSIPCIIWSEHKVIKYISYSTIAVFSGITLGYLMSILLQASSLLVAVASAGIALSIVVGSKNITVLEISQMVKSSLNRN